MARRNSTYTQTASPALQVRVADVKGQRHDCRNCTRCCRELVVHLTRHDRERLDEQDWTGKLDIPAYVRLGEDYVLNHAADGACVFLGDDNLCRIHATFGYDAKPLACRLYPFTLEPDVTHREVVHASPRFDCPSVACATGRVLSKHRGGIERIVAELQATSPIMLVPSARHIDIRADQHMAPEELDMFVEHLDNWLRIESRPVSDRLLGLAGLLDTLDGADINKIRGERLGELVSMLLADMPNVIEPMRALPAPSPRQLKLFRQAVFAHCENITLEKARAPFLSRWAYRLDQFKRAGRLVRGEGIIPSLVSGSQLSTVTFARLAEIRPSPSLIGADCDDLIARYIRTRILGRTAFGPGYYGWSVLDGLAALLLSVAVVGWVTRHVAIRKDADSYDFDDVIQAVGIVNRNVGRSPELGGRVSRMRLNYIKQESGIARMLGAYPLLS